MINVTDFMAEQQFFSSEIVKKNSLHDILSWNFELI